ncbi:PRC and DUF2382 domain-containing protein [Kitasatospora sp. NPDC001547]|uniref:PRC and DUF2382 domain-containing protein n=1 Tax=Kitasatospora sp. NPDC001547 TaxID=3364015 RepID=UPI0036869CFD
MQTDIDPRDLIGHKAVDRNGDKIGTVDEVYLDDATGRPEWAAVRTGIFGRDAFVPLTTSEFSGEELRVPYDKSLVKESPDFGVGQHLSPAQELQLYRYYGLDTSMDGRPNGENGSHAKQPDLDFGTTAAAATTTAAAPAKPLTFHTPERSPEPAPARTPVPTAAAPGSTAPTLTAPTVADTTRTAPEADMRTLSTPSAATSTTAPPTTPSVAPAMEPRPHSQPAPAPAPTTTTAANTGSAPSGPVEITCREERLEITTEWHTLGTAKLRKYVTTEQVERRVPVVRERVRVERMPVSEAERAALTEKDIAEAVEEVTIREERPVVHKHLAPIERVRLIVERYTTEETVREELRREHVEVHDTTAGQAHGSPTDSTPAAASSRPAPVRPLV